LTLLTNDQGTTGLLYNSEIPSPLSSARVAGMTIALSCFSFSPILVPMSQPLDPGMLRFNAALAASTPPGAEHWPLATQRETWNAVCSQFRAPLPATIESTDVNAAGVSCRILKPKGQGLKAGVIYGHGGGWVLGGFDTHTDICAELAIAADCVVVLMDYRLAPEHRYPAQLEDSLKVWRWMREQGQHHGLDPQRIIAAGDSAGGQMSVALAMTLRDLGLPQVMGMLLLYPVLGGNLDTPSYLRNAHATSLSREEMRFYLESFLGPPGSPAWADDKALPLLAQNVEGLPPAFITVADHDPLLDDGVMFHETLHRGGVASVLRREPALGHSYLRARHHSAAALEGFQAIAEALKAMAG
jgi:acetyl esterase